MRGMKRGLPFFSCSGRRRGGCKSGLDCGGAQRQGAVASLRKTSVGRRNTTSGEIGSRRSGASELQRGCVSSRAGAARARAGKDRCEHGHGHGGGGAGGADHADEVDDDADEQQCHGGEDGEGDDQAHIDVGVVIGRARGVILAEERDAGRDDASREEGERLVRARHVRRAYIGMARAWCEGAQMGFSSPGGAQMRLVALSWLGSPYASANRLSESTVSSLPREMHRRLWEGAQAGPIWLLMSEHGL
eukprot:scaffold18834_cov56-Phaeocystis_antarctica.AAC.1